MEKTTWTREDLLKDYAEWNGGYCPAETPPEDMDKYIELALPDHVDPSWANEVFLQEMNKETIPAAPPIKPKKAGVVFEQEFIEGMVAVEVRDDWTTIITEGADRLGRVVGYTICSELEQELSFEDWDVVVVRPIPIHLGLDIRLETDPHVFNFTGKLSRERLEQVIRKALSCAEKVINMPTR